MLKDIPDSLSAINQFAQLYWFACLYMIHPLENLLMIYTSSISNLLKFSDIPFSLLVLANGSSGNTDIFIAKLMMINHLYSGCQDQLGWFQKV